ELPIGSKRVYQMPELKLPEGLTLADQLRVDTYRGAMQRYPALDEGVMRSYLANVLGTPVEAAALSSLPSGVTLDDASLEQVLLALARAGEASKLDDAELAADESGAFRRRGGYRYAHLEAFAAAQQAAGGVPTAGGDGTGAVGTVAGAGPANEGGGATPEATTGSSPAITVLERCEYELGIIISMGFADYYLIVADFINWAKRQGIAVGPGRGSGAGSITAYCIGITNIDPLYFNLLFERFLNPERISMPDFDIDFSDVRRGEVIEYVREKYGDDRVAHIATFGTMASKA